MARKSEETEVREFLLKYLLNVKGYMKLDGKGKGRTNNPVNFGTFLKVSAARDSIWLYPRRLEREQ